MSPALLTRKRVHVTSEPYCFVVTVDDKPVLRCTIRRDALRYAVLVRRSLRRAELPGGLFPAAPEP